MTLIKIIILNLPIIIVTSQYLPSSAISSIGLICYAIMCYSSCLDHYSDQDYYQLAAEYEDNLRASFAVRQAKEEVEKLVKQTKIAEQSENGKVPVDGQAIQQKSNKKDGESYAEMASRLKCDNPWFWNAPRCTWIDVKAKHFGNRRKRNAETSAWLIGSILGFVMILLCAMYCSYRIKMRNRLKMMKLREKYAPGRIELPNGKIVEYRATEEETKAYGELVKAIIIQEMSLLV